MADAYDELLQTMLNRAGGTAAPAPPPTPNTAVGNTLMLGLQGVPFGPVIGQLPMVQGAAKESARLLAHVPETLAWLGGHIPFEGDAARNAAQATQRALTPSPGFDQYLAPQTPGERAGAVLAMPAMTVAAGMLGAPVSAGAVTSELLGDSALARWAPWIFKPAAKVARVAGDAAQGAAEAHAQGADPGVGAVLGGLGGATANVLNMRAFKPQFPVRSPEEQAALDYMHAHGMPTDLGTELNSPTARNILVQTGRAGFGGAVPAQRFARAGGEALTTAGEAERAAIGLPPITGSEETAATAGGNVALRGLHAREITERAAADTAYDALRQQEARAHAGGQPQTLAPGQVGPYTVSLQPVRQTATELYSSLIKNRTHLTPGEAVVAGALEKLMQRPLLMATSDADEVLSELKGLQGALKSNFQNNGVARRTLGRAISAFSDAVDLSVAHDPYAAGLLRDARQAVRAQHAAMGTRQAISPMDAQANPTRSPDLQNPVQAFGRVIQPADRALPALKRLLANAPQTQGDLARALTDKLLTGKDGVLGSGDAWRTFSTRWRQIGPGTKAALYTPAQRETLDLLARVGDEYAKIPAAKAQSMSKAASFLAIPMAITGSALTNPTMRNVIGGLVTGQYDPMARTLGIIGPQIVTALMGGQAGQAPPAAAR